MISLFYKLKLLNYILSSFKDTVVKVLLFTAYLYLSSITLMFLSHGFQYAMEFSSPKNAFSQLYLYFKWYYNSKDHLGYGIYVRTFIAFFIPYFFYKLFLNIKWSALSVRLVKQILTLFRRKNVYNQFNETASQNEAQDTYETETESVNAIKQLLIQDIEQVIDKRLNDIFLSKRK